MTTQRDLIASALDKLGSEKASRMMLAFDTLHRTPQGGWFDCPLAYAYGEPGTLIQEKGHYMDISWDDEPVMAFGVTPHDVAYALDLDVTEVESITTAYDERACEVGKAELFQMIEEVSRQPVGAA